MFWKLLKEELDKLIEKDSELNYYEAFIVFVSLLETWPTVSVISNYDTEEGELEMDDDEEPLGTDNFGIAVLNEKSIVLCSGNEYQSPLQATLTLEADGGFVLSDIQCGFDNLVTAGHFINKIIES